MVDTFTAQHACLTASRTGRSAWPMRAVCMAAWWRPPTGPVA